MTGITNIEIQMIPLPPPNAVNVNFVNEMVSGNNAVINTMIEDKISEAEKI